MNVIRGQERGALVVLHRLRYGGALACAADAEQGMLAAASGGVLPPCSRGRDFLGGVSRVMRCAWIGRDSRCLDE